MTKVSDWKTIVFYFIDDDVMTNGTQKKKKIPRSASLFRKEDCARKTVGRNRAFILIC